MRVRSIAATAAAVGLAAGGGLVLSTGTADAAQPWEQKTHWYASKVSIHSESAAGKRTCVYGNAEDKAGFDKKYNVTGKIWEQSFERKVLIQRKVGKKWVRVKSVWTDDDYNYNYAICFKVKKGKYRAHVGTYYPYNTVLIRARSANSKTIKVG